MLLKIVLIKTADTDIMIESYERLIGPSQSVVGSFKSQTADRDLIGTARSMVRASSCTLESLAGRPRTCGPCTRVVRAWQNQLRTL
jgi:hypothetical protein